MHQNYQAEKELSDKVKEKVPPKYNIDDSIPEKELLNAIKLEKQKLKDEREEWEKALTEIEGYNEKIKKLELLRK